MRKALSYFLIVCIAFSAIAVSGSAAEAAAPAIPWWNANPAAEVNPLADVAFNQAGVYVAVGQNGTIVRSTDSKTWTRANSATSQPLTSVVANGKRFVAVGDGVVVTSADGLTWTKGTVSIGATYGSQFGAERQKSFSKNNSVNWTAKIAVQDLKGAQAIWDGRRFVAVGQWETHPPSKLPATSLMGAVLSGYYAMTSSDGLNWKASFFQISDKQLTALKNPSFIVPGGILKTIFTGKKYLAFTENGAILASADLQKWDLYDPRFQGIPQDVTYHDGTYMAIVWDGSISTITGAVYASSDGATWRKVVDKKNPRVFDRLIMRSIAWDGKQYVIAGNNGLLIQSTDGQEWDLLGNRASVEFVPFTKIVFSLTKIVSDGKQWLQLGSDGSIRTTSDLYDGQIVYQRSNLNLDHIAYDGKGRYIANSNYNGTIYESEDGYRWKAVAVEASGVFWWKDFVILNGVAIGYGYDNEDEYYYSPAPGQWTKHSFPVKLDTITKVEAFGGRFYFYTRDGYIESTDGLTWSPLRKSAKPIAKIVSNGKTTIGLTTDTHNYIYATSDGIHWKPAQLKIGERIDKEMSSERIFWNGKRFVASVRTIDYGYVFATSADGVNWQGTPMDKYADLLAWDGQRYAAYHMEGQLYESADGAHYKPSTVVTRHEINDLLWDGKKWIAVGDGKAVLIGGPRPSVQTGEVATVQADGATSYVIRTNPAKIKAEEEEKKRQEEEARRLDKEKLQERLASVRELAEAQGYQVEDMPYSSDTEATLLVKSAGAGQNALSLLYSTNTGGYASDDKIVRRQSIDYTGEATPEAIDMINRVIETQTGKKADITAEWLESLGLDYGKPARGTLERGGIQFRYDCQLVFKDPNTYGLVLFF